MRRARSPAAFTARPGLVVFTARPGLGGALLAFVLGVLVLACGIPPSERGHGSKASPRDVLEGITLETLTIDLSGPAVPRYGSAVDHELGPSEQGIADRLAELPMKHSPAISRLTRELARTAPAGVSVLPPALIEGVMVWAGLVDPHLRFVWVDLSSDPHRCDLALAPACADALDSLLQQVVTTMPRARAVEFGIGVARRPPGGTRLMVSILEPKVVLEPFAREVALGSTIVLAGRLGEGRSDPRVEVVDPNGAWSRVPISAGPGPSFRANVTCSRVRGRHQVEILAEGQHGPEVAANFPLYCGVRAPLRLQVEQERIDPSVTAKQVARANLHYLNEERARRGLPRLEWDERAATVAVEHSHDMARHGFVGHRSPTTGEAADRFAAARIDAAVLRENVALGYGPKSIHESLMRSPVHRENLLANDVTRVGIGVVMGEPESQGPGAPRPFYCTQNLLREPGAGAPSDKRLVPVLKQKVDALRKQHRLGEARWIGTLDRSARVVAEAAANGRAPPKGWQQAAYALDYGTIESHQVESADFEALLDLEAWKRPALEAGVAVIRTKRNGRVGFLAVVLIGER